MTTAVAEPSARRKFWGWGREGEGLSRAELEDLGTTFAERFGLDGIRMQQPPQVAELDLAAPRLTAPESIATLLSADPYDRAAHAYGRSFRDLVRAFRRDYSRAPDLVAFPRDEHDVAAVADLTGVTEARPGTPARRSRPQQAGGSVLAGPWLR